MAFKDKDVQFSLKDVGSKIIDQLSTDVYTGPDSIMRELVKNGYDALIAPNLDEIDDDDFERRIVVSRSRDNNGVGRLFIADNGLGQDLNDLKANVQISISRKQDELENATGFRGLGSWAILGGGSQVVISSSKLGDTNEYRLTLDVKRIYEKLGAMTTLDDVLNDKKCISFTSDRKDADDHFTTVEIICDGEATKVNGHELNRLYAFTDPDEDDLRDILIRACPIPFADNGGSYEQIHAIYEETGYVPIPIVLDGERLERRLPASVSEFKRHELIIGDTTAAIAWVVEDPDQSRELVNRINEQQHSLGRAGLQLMKFNVPIGRKNLFGDNVRSTILNWFIGEIHIVAPDVLPDAGGNNLRAGTARESFLKELRSFYKKLEEQAESKSTRLSLIRRMQQGQEAARKLQDKDKHLSATEEQQARTKVANAVEAIEKTGKRKEATSIAEKRVRAASRDATVKDVRKETRRALKDTGYLDEFAAKPSKKATPKKAASASETTKNAGKSTGSIHGLTEEQFSAQVGRIIPKLERIGLSDNQIEQVLALIQELVTD